MYLVFNYPDDDTQRFIGDNNDIPIEQVLLGMISDNDDANRLEQQGYTVIDVTDNKHYAPWGWTPPND